MHFQQILEKYRKISFSERDKGDRFERLMQAYLQTDPKYAFHLKKAWFNSDNVAGNTGGFIPKRTRPC